MSRVPAGGLFLHFLLSLLTALADQRVGAAGWVMGVRSESAARSRRDASATVEVCGDGRPGRREGEEEEEEGAGMEGKQRGRLALLRLRLI